MKLIKKKKSLFLNMQGFSLIELIITIAIMGLIASVAVGMTNYIRYANTKEVVEDLEGAINKLQVNSMSKAEKRVLYIYKAGGNYYVKTGTTSEVFNAGGLGSFLNTNAQKLGNSGIKISGKNSTGGTVDVTGNTDGEIIKISYKKAGIFDTAATNVSEILVKGSGEHKITLLTNTGKVKIE